MSKLKFSLLLPVLLVSGCDLPWSKTSKEIVPTPLYYTDYADTNKISDTLEAGSNQAVSEFKQPTIVVSWQGREELLARFQTLLPQGALEQLTATYEKAGSTAWGQVSSVPGTLYWFSPKELPNTFSATTGTWVLQTKAPLTQADAAAFQQKSTLLVSKRDQFTYIGAEVDYLESVASNQPKLEALNSRTNQSLSIDFYPSIELIESLSRNLPTSLSAPDTDPLVQVLLACLRNTDRISAYLTVDSANQELAFSLTTAAAQDSLLRNLYSSVVGSPGPEGKWMSPKNAVEMQVGSFNHVAIEKFLTAQPESNKDLLRIFLAYLKIAKGNYAGAKYQDSKGQVYSSWAIELNPNMQASLIRYVDQGTKYISAILKNRSLLETEAVFQGPDARGVYSYLPPKLVGNPNPDQLYFGFVSNYVTLTSNRAALDSLVQSISSKTELSPNLLSSARLNPFTLNYALTYVPVPDLTGGAPRNIPIRTSLEAGNGTAGIHLSLSKEWVSYFTSIATQLIEAQGTQNSAPLPVDAKKPTAKK